MLRLIGVKTKYNKKKDIHTISSLCRNKIQLIDLLSGADIIKLASSPLATSQTCHQVDIMSTSCPHLQYVTWTGVKIWPPQTDLITWDTDVKQEIQFCSILHTVAGNSKILLCNVLLPKQTSSCWEVSNPKSVSCTSNFSSCSDCVAL